MTTAAAGALLCACGGSGSVPNQVLTKPAPVSAPAPLPRTSGPWIYRPSPQRQAFVVDQKATIAIRSDTATRVDTISSHAEISFTFSAQTATAAGTVGAFLVQGGGRAAVTPAGLATPFPFRGAYPVRGAQFDFTAPRDVTPCSSMSLGALQSLRDVWIRPPDTLRMKMTWKDSSTYAVCRDGIPLRASVHRTFEVFAATEPGGRLLLTISRISDTAIEGVGTQFGDTIKVSGKGSGQLFYFLDPASGEIISANGTSALDLTVRSRLRTQVVRQTAETLLSRN